jgi:signal transduction histidine kinase/CheY-like chemotaxis protein/HPt (histidine-containing phosphotransfer) domain-containing protein
MTTDELVDRLAEHKTLSTAPRAELEWLASHGSLRELRAGEKLAIKGEVIEHLWVVLSGHFAIYATRRSGPYLIMEWLAGDVTGVLPYSRLGAPPGDNLALAASLVLAIHRDHFPEMVRECHEITSTLVSIMVDRARASTAIQLQEARLEAEEANRAKSEFLAKMSHEIRTPLNAVIGMADVLASGDLTSHQRRCVEVSQRNGIALLNLINDILDLSKVESGKVELESIGFDLRDVIAGAAEAVEVRAQGKGLWLRRSVAPGVPLHLIGDPNRLRQVIVNLLGNSIKFTAKGGLEVHVEPDVENPEPGRLRFAVTDTGIGIPQDKVDKIFESFSQADSSTTRQYGGTGLGLSISKHLIALMDGRIWVQSDVGNGSTFFFTARFGVDADQSERRPATLTLAPHIVSLEAALAGLRILLADDSDDNRFLILSYLRGASATIEVAENGETALHMFQAGHYNVVLMDVEMPVMDGLSATRAIRRWENEQGMSPTPVYALTAHAFAEMVARGSEFGFTGVLTKPIRQLTLLEVLARHSKSEFARRANGGVAAAEPEPQPADAPTGPIAILVADGLEDIVPTYLDKRRADLPVYRQALDSGDFESIRKMAHKTKGAAGGYGFQGLTELGGALEQAAIRTDGTLIRTKLDEYAEYLERIELKYSKRSG